MASIVYAERLFRFLTVSFLKALVITCIVARPAQSFVISHWYPSDAPIYSYWVALDVDSSGQFAVAASPSPYNSLYQSLNYGRNWTVMPNAPFEDWHAIAINSTGEFIAAAGTNTTVFISNDRGSSWFPTSALYNDWQTLTMDLSGQYIVGTHDYSDFDGNQGISYSLDYGSTWSSANVPPGQSWRSVASSASGEIVYAVSTDEGMIVTSINFGVDWTMTSALALDWDGIATDASGRFAIATASGVGLYVTNDTGASWQKTSALALDWYSVASDSTGRFLAAVAESPDSSIYNSNDFGATWYVTYSSQQSYLLNVASDSSGQYLIAGSEFLSGILTTDNTGSSFSPSASPTVFPSSVPSSMPSTQPSGQPSSFPTYNPGTFETTVSVSSQQAASSTTIANLGMGGSVFVTANLLLSYLSEASGGYITITAGTGGNVLFVSQQCAPVQACPSGSNLVSTYCAVNIDVSSVITSEAGGSLQINANANTLHISGSNPSLCSYEGVQGLYYIVNYTVSAYRQPTPSPTQYPTAQPSKSGDTIIINSGQTDLITSGGAPFYVIGVAMALFAGIGVLVVRLHDTSKGLTPLKLFAVCSDMGLQGNLIISEIFYITVLLQSSSKLFEALAIVLIFARLQNAICGAYLLYQLYTPATELYEKLNKEIFLQHTKLHSVVQILMIFDCAMFRYLPWMASNSTFQSLQFPDAKSFKLCMVTRLLQSGLALVVQSVVLNQLNKSDLNDDYTLSLLCLIMIMTVILFASIVLTIVMHMRELKSPPGQSVDGTAASRSNPLHDDMEMASIGGNGASAGSTAVVWLERVSLLEKEVAVLKDQQEAQKKEFASLKKEFQQFQNK